MLLLILSFFDSTDEKHTFLNYHGQNDILYMPFFVFVASCSCSTRRSHSAAVCFWFLKTIISFFVRYAETQIHQITYNKIPSIIGFWTNL